MNPFTIIEKAMRELKQTSLSLNRDEKKALRVLLQAWHYINDQNWLQAGYEVPEGRK